MVCGSQEAAPRRLFTAVAPTLLLVGAHWGAKINFSAHREGASPSATQGPFHAPVVADSTMVELGRYMISITSDQGLHKAPVRHILLHSSIPRRGRRGRAMGSKRSAAKNAP